MRAGHLRIPLFVLTVAGLLLAGCSIENLGLRDSYTGQSLIQPDKLPSRVTRDTYGDPVPSSADGAVGRFSYRRYHHGQE